MMERIYMNKISQLTVSPLVSAQQPHVRFVYHMNMLYIYILYLYVAIIYM